MDAIALLSCVMDDDSSGAIARVLRTWIVDAPPGSRLPSTRDIAAQHGAGPGTVQRALRTLTTAGLIETRPGVGTFVRAGRLARPVDYGWQTAALRSPSSRVDPVPRALRTAPNDMLALHSGYPDRSLLPERLVRSALGRAARSDTALRRSPVAGLPELQQWFADDLAATTPSGMSTPTARDVLVIPGSQSGLGAAFRALIDRGQPLLMESPTYWGAILAASQAGAHVVPVPSGHAGPDPQELDRAFAETGSRLFYAQPNYANPTGAQWSPDTRDAVLEVVRRHRAFLIEDDWAHDFGIETTATPVASFDDHGHVIYLRSLTKSVSPAIRVAAVIARGPARERILGEQGAGAMYVSGVLQAAALDVVTQPGWSTHLRQMRRALGSRRDLLLTGLRELAPQAHVAHVPRGGFNLWARLPDGTDVHEVTRRCEAEGLLLGPGGEWFPAEPTGPFVRLNYSGPEPSVFTEAAGILGQVLGH
ncbi:PLP-dependent aminotransferase family protein [Nocardioides salsibiostraticola]